MSRVQIAVAAVSKFAVERFLAAIWSRRTTTMALVAVLLACGGSTKAGEVYFANPPRQNNDVGPRLYSNYSLVDGDATVVRLWSGFASWFENGGEGHYDFLGPSGEPIVRLLTVNTTVPYYSRFPNWPERPPGHVYSEWESRPSPLAELRILTLDAAGQFPGDIAGLPSLGQVPLGDSVELRLHSYYVSDMSGRIDTNVPFSIIAEPDFAALVVTPEPAGWVLVFLASVCLACVRIHRRGWRPALATANRLKWRHRQSA